MGLFNKHKKDEYEEDFILELEPVAAGPGSPYSAEPDDEDDEFGITPWDRRAHSNAPHAMTADEILGGEAQSGFSDIPVANGFKNAEKEEATEESGQEATRSFSVPKDQKPEFSAGEHHAETEVIAPTPDTANADSEIKSKADELIRSIKERSLKNAAEGKEATAQPTEPEIKEQPINEPANKPQIEETAIQQPEQKAEPKAEAAPIAARRDSGLSPKAQELYDRMMAERAKGKLLKSELKDTAEANAEPKAEAAHLPATEKVLPTPEAAPEIIPPITPIQSEPVDAESVADAIFDTLTLSLNNPLRKRENESLLSKCKNFVNDELPKNPERSIDDIIHNAEQNARQRLSSFYEQGMPEAPKEKYNFEMFSESYIPNTDTPDAIDGDTRVINLESFSEGSTFKEDIGEEVTNLQYSLADELPQPPEIDATREVEIPSAAGHQADPVKAAAWHEHLKVLAEKEPEEAPPERMHLAGVDEPELPEGEIPDFKEEAPAVDDYATLEDAESIRTDLKSQTVSVTARIISTAAISAILLVCDYIFASSLMQSPMTFMLLNTVMLGLGLIINFNTLKGIAGIFTGNPDMDSPAALSAAMVFIYTVVTAASGTMAAMPVLAPIGAITLLFNLIGKRSILRRIRRGFDVIANDNLKNAVTFVEDKLSASVMAGGSVVGEALIAMGRPVKNITGYLKNAYSEDAYERKLNVLMVFTLIAAAVLAIIAFFTGGIWESLTAFTLATCAACPPSSLLICSLPFGLTSKKLKGYGAMLAGSDAVERIANANAVAFDVSELFPAGSIKLYNMQVLNRGAVDKYIAAAAALLTAAKSPLAPIFEEILQTNGEEMPDIDSIKYENNMGLSGWIEDKRIFVGNRTLMEGHSIKTPSLELDKKILRGGYFPVYLGIGDQLCALFIVGYEADEEITYELRRLCNTGVTMLVNSNDPNVSDEMLCDYFGLYPDSIKVLSSSGVTAYKSAASYRESVSAAASFGDNICGLLSTITGAIKLKSIIDTLIIINIIFICLSVAAVGYLALSGTLLTLSGALAFLAGLISAAVTAAIAYIKQS